MTQPNAAGGRGAPGRRESRGRLIGDGLSWTARWSLRLILTALGLSLIGVVIGQLWSIVLPVLLGLIIATVLEPPATWMRHHGVPSLLAALIVVVGALAVVGGVIAAIMPSVIGQVPQLAAGATAGLGDVERWVSTTFGLGQSQIGQVVQGTVNQLQSSATSIAGTVLTGLTTIANGVIDAVLALVLAFLFVKDGYRFLPWMRRQVGTGAGEHLAEVGARAWDRLGGFIRSQAIVGFIDAACIGIGLVVIGVPLALPLAVLTFFGAFIPIVGALTAGALSVLIALVSKGFTTALIVLVLILAVQQIEGNLLQPLVQGRGLGLHAAVIILAVTGGGSVAGIVGAFLAVPVVAVTAEIARYVNEQIDMRARSDEEHPSEVAPAPPAKQPRTRWSILRRVRNRRNGSSREIGDDGASPDGAGPPADGTPAAGGPREGAATNE
ncbi:AI-2E family transporter [Actinomycetospora sp. TBRC 11914]|uniref:AI-2E family transporter n=1 Tax=Actinomycetospora sp. TBRC 11914 TaxID=2729387 RepID=UPI00145EA2D4|nr:AI-2E family transporter [Actinomycetospora sp. TBRC 11914]NMO93850.1 AI-2E family transporter [Actinomycetospora sp. TBRC 11914]